jgi:hypothetical protein
MKIISTASTKILLTIITVRINRQAVALPTSHPPFHALRRPGESSEKDEREYKTRSFTRKKDNVDKMKAGKQRSTKIGHSPSGHQEGDPEQDFRNAVSQRNGFHERKSVPALNNLIRFVKALEATEKERSASQGSLSPVCTSLIFKLKLP